MRFLSILLMTLVIMPFVYAQSLPPSVPESGDIAASINILLNAKALGAIGLGAAIILIVVQFLKSSLFDQIFKSLDPKYKRLLITLLGVVYGVLYLIVSGKSGAEAIMVGLFSSGGAVAIFEAIAPFLKKNDK